MPAYVVRLESVSACLRRLRSFSETPMVNNRPAGLPGWRSPTAPQAAVPVSLNPGSWHSRCRIINQRLGLAERVAYGCQSSSILQAALGSGQRRGSRGAGGLERSACCEAGAPVSGQERNHQLPPALSIRLVPRWHAQARLSGRLRRDQITSASMQKARYPYSAVGLSLCGALEGGTRRAAGV
jgi:hypothetical protein